MSLNYVGKNFTYVLGVTLYWIPLHNYLHCSGQRSIGGEIQAVI
jgi:hypothetical protein